MLIISPPIPRFPDVRIAHCITASFAPEAAQRIILFILAVQIVGLCVFIVLAYVNKKKMVRIYSRNSRDHFLCFSRYNFCS